MNIFKNRAKFKRTSGEREEKEKLKIQNTASVYLMRNEPQTKS